MIKPEEREIERKKQFTDVYLSRSVGQFNYLMKIFKKKSNWEGSEREIKREKIV